MAAGPTPATDGRLSREAPLVLVVDDEPGMRHLFRTFLEWGGYRVREAVSVAEAREDLRAQGCPDLVLLDWRLSDGLGDAFCAELRAMPAGRTVPIIVVSGSRVPPDVVARFGVAMVLVKPIELDDLLAHVRSALEWVPPDR